MAHLNLTKSFPDIRTVADLDGTFSCLDEVDPSTVKHERWLDESVPRLVILTFVLDFLNHQVGSRPLGERTNVRPPDFDHWIESKARKGDNVVSVRSSHIIVRSRSGAKVLVEVREVVTARLHQMYVVEDRSTVTHLGLDTMSGNEGYLSESASL